MTHVRKASSNVEKKKKKKVCIQLPLILLPLIILGCNNGTVMFEKLLFCNCSHLVWQLDRYNTAEHYSEKHEKSSSNISFKETN